MRLLLLREKRGSCTVTDALVSACFAVAAPLPLTHELSQVLLLPSQLPLWVGVLAPRVLAGGLLSISGTICVPTVHVICSWQ